MPQFNPTVWPILVYFAIVVALMAIVLVLSAVLGPRQHHRRDGAAGETYESGLVSTGSAHIRFAVKFYLIAMFFVIFDLEAAFIYLYAVTFRELGWTGYIEILVFIGVLIAGLIYLWRVGALEWGTSKHVDARRTKETPS